LIRAVIAVAVADGRVRSSEKGVIEALANRVGVGRVSLSAMIDRAKRDPSFRDEVFRLATADPARALKILVSTARIDGEISTEERELLVALAQGLGVTGPRFEQVYQEGIQAADEVRRRRGG
jgi:tellurite resistance protein